MTNDCQTRGGLWRGVAIPRSRDVRLLMPPTMPRDQRFESMREARTRNLARIEVLSEREPDIADAINECGHDGAASDSPGCAVCARDYQIFFTSETLGVARNYAGPHKVATIYLDATEAGSLSEVSIERAHARLRKRLQRGGFRGSVLVGGTEAAWIARERSWIVHVHVLAIGVQPSSWERLRASLGEVGAATPLKVEALKDDARALSYLTKFATYHRPFRRGSGGPSRAFPLPPARLAELAAWWAEYGFEDFAFLFGARRRGGRIVPEV